MGSDVFSSETITSLLTLTFMEIVLGVDNIVFISILTSKLPTAQQPRARSIGLALALFLRIALLLAISEVMRLTTPLFAVLGHGFSGRDLILLVGGVFLVGKATHEIYDKLEVDHHETPDIAARKVASFGLIIVQILALDIVFSLDSVITAVGMAQQIWVMVVAITLAVGVMLAFSGKISDFVNKHPSMKILALSFLILIGVMLVAEGTGKHVSKGYIYAAMSFSLLVEILNMRFRAKHQRPVALHSTAEKYESLAPAGGPQEKVGSPG